MKDPIEVQREKEFLYNMFCLLLILAPFGAFQVVEIMVWFFRHVKVAFN